MPDSAQTGIPKGAAFLSYASQDSEAARRICEALRSAGIEVWLDQSELRGGDAWDQSIRRQIKECVLFIPIVSANTQARSEGYFRREWRLAVERMHDQADDQTFLVPIVIDGVDDAVARVPERFRERQWIRLPGAIPTPQFALQIKRMLEEPSGAALVVSQYSPARPAAAHVHPQPTIADDKAIAVLPFENMSEDKGNTFFADGVHEDVLTNLSFIRDLRVISRTSVMQYRGTTKSIKQIGLELGVAYVLEGSVRRAGSKVRVTSQLIDARTDVHAWGKAYDREVTDIFAIQGELAEAIADSLKSVLSPETKAILTRRPTENAAAYDAYLRARQLRNSADFLTTATRAISELEGAVRLDSNFAAAWADLASLRVLAYFRFEQTERLIGQAREAIDTAVRLAPDDPAVIKGLGDFHYYGYRDYARATEQYLRLAMMRPNDPAMYFSLALIQRRQGRWADSISNFRRALKLDPTNGAYIIDFTLSLIAVRFYDEAEALLRTFIEGHGGNLTLEGMLCWTVFDASGSTGEMQTFARRAVDPSEREAHLNSQRNNARMCGNWADFVRLDRELGYVDNDPRDPRWNQDLKAAESFAEAGDMAAAQARAAEAMVPIKTELARQPGNSRLWAGLSLVHALLGNRDEAIRSAQKSVELLPESHDAVFGRENSAMCALALAWIGEKDRALSEIGRLLLTPWGLNTHEIKSSFRPLRDEPRFKELVSDPRNNDPLL